MCSTSTTRATWSGICGTRASASAGSAPTDTGGSPAGSPASWLPSPDEAAQRGHELLAHLVAVLRLGAEHAVPHMVVDQRQRHLVEGRPHGADLLQHVD